MIENTDTILNQAAMNNDLIRFKHQANNIIRYTNDASHTRTISILANAIEELTKISSKDILTLEVILD